MKVMGVDPGVRGAIVVTRNGKRPRHWKMPMRTKDKHGYDIAHIAEIVRKERPDLLAVEHVTRPASLVRCMGLLEAIGVTLGIEVVTIRPQVWKRHYNLSTNKAESIKLAAKLWPKLGKSMKRKSDDGIAEAALIGEYARIVYQRAIDYVAAPSENL